MTELLSQYGILIAALAHRLDADRLRKLFGLLLAVVALRMVWQALGAG